MNKSMQAALVLSVMLVATLAVAIVADGTDADSGIPDDAVNPADAGTICTVGGTEYTSLIDAKMDQHLETPSSSKRILPNLPL